MPICGHSIYRILCACKGKDRNLTPPPGSTDGGKRPLKLLALAPGACEVGRVPANRTRQKRFRTKIGGTEKGRVYIPLPFDPAHEWGERGRYYVAGTINGVKFRGRLDEAGDGYFLPLGPAWRRDSGVRPGAAVDGVSTVERPPRAGQ